MCLYLPLTVYEPSQTLVSIFLSLISLDSVFNQARELGTYWVEGLPPDSPDRLVEALVAVTPQQVQAVAQKYFVDEQLTVANLLPLAGPRAAMRKPIPGARHTEGTR